MRLKTLILSIPLMLILTSVSLGETLSCKALGYIPKVTPEGYKLLNGTIVTFKDTLRSFITGKYDLCLSKTKVRLLVPSQEI
jgi:hypothetical protein